MAERTYSNDEVEDRLARELPRWRFEDGHLCRTYRVNGWKSAMLATAAIGHLAEAAWHHPELRVTYGTVGVRLMTHSARGITDKDFALAAKIEEVVQWRPAAEAGPLEGTPADPRYAYIKADE